MPKYRDWDEDSAEYEEEYQRQRREQRRRATQTDPDEYWDRKRENRQKWNKKHPGRRG